MVLVGNMTTLPSSVKHNAKINHDRHHRNDTKKSEVCPKSTIKTPECRRSGVFIANSSKLVVVNFINFTSDLFLVFL